MKKKQKKKKPENVFVKHYAPNHMSDPKGEWSLLENINGTLMEIIPNFINQSTYHLQSADKESSPFLNSNTFQSIKC